MKSKIEQPQLSPKFNSEKYIEKRLKEISEISGLTFWGADGKKTAPKFSANKIYEDYYKQAQSGGITEEILKKHELDIYSHLFHFKTPNHPMLHYLEPGQTHDDLIATGDYDLSYDLYNPLMPMVNQFALCAALSNLYLVNGNQDQSLAFTIRAVEIFGSIERYKAELTNARYVTVFTELPYMAKEMDDENDHFKKKALGGSGKGNKADALAMQYWGICIKDPAFQGIVKKHPRMGMKFSDELFALLQSKVSSENAFEKIEQIPYSSGWFYTKVVKKYRSQI